jgi:hypothetical protein
MAGADGQLYKEAVLVHEDITYANMEAKTSASLRLTRWLQFPVPTYSGKVGVIWDVIGCRPYLGVGDSPGDLAMLSFCENRLWLARQEKPDYQKSLLTACRQTGSETWLQQPVRCKKDPGFLPNL